jgi:hypothetical protein
VNAEARKNIRRWRRDLGGAVIVFNGVRCDLDGPGGSLVDQRAHRRSAMRTVARRRAMRRAAS